MLKRGNIIRMVLRYIPLFFSFLLERLGYSGEWLCTSISGGAASFERPLVPSAVRIAKANNIKS